jgi:hypothetical protein
VDCSDDKNLYKDAKNSGAIKDIIYLDNGDKFQRDGYLILTEREYRLFEHGVKMEKCILVGV